MSYKLTTSKTPTAPSAPAVKAITSPADFDALPDSAYIRKKQLIPNVVPISSATLHRKCKAGQFPPSYKLFSRVSAWRVGDVRSFLAGQASW